MSVASTLIAVFGLVTIVLVVVFRKSLKDLYLGIGSARLGARSHDAGINMDNAKSGGHMRATNTSGIGGISMKGADSGGDMTADNGSETTKKNSSQSQ